MEFSEGYQVKNVSVSHPVYYRRVGIPINPPPPHYCMLPWNHRHDLWFTSLQYLYIFLLKYHINMLFFSLFRSLLITIFQRLSSSWALVYYIVSSTNSSLLGWLVVSLKVKLLLPPSILEIRRLVRFWRFFSDDLAISAFWIRLAENSIFTVVWNWCNTWQQIQRGQSL